MDFIEVLDTARADLSKNKFSKKVGVLRSAVLSWYNNGVIPKDEVLEKLAEISALPVEIVLFSAYAEKIHNPVIAELLRNNSNLSAH